MKCPHCDSENVTKNGNSRAKCQDCRKSFNTPAPSLTQADNLPDGVNLRGTSTLTDLRTGQSLIQWVKTTAAHDALERQLRAAFDGMADFLPREPRRKPPAHCVDELLSQYTVTDYHLGMLAWGEETGADWDIKIAEDMLVAWFAQAIKQAPESRYAVFAQLGDFLHFDGYDAVTPAHHNLLDADTRFPKLVRVAIRVIRRIIGMLLEKHQIVYVIMAEGNHDPASSIWLREWLASVFEDEPRIQVDTSPDPYYCIEHGDTLLLYHHGHKRRPNEIDTVFAAKFREQFGRTKHAYAHMGHMHHDIVVETALMVVEQHRTLAAPDAYASRAGYMAGRSAKVITYDKRLGEVNRVTVSSQMVEAHD